MLLRGPAVRAAPPCRAQRARCAPARGAMHVRAAAGADGLADKLQLGALRPGAEVINGRAAMLGFLGVAVTELATGKTAWAQMGSGGLITALLLMGAVSAASVAPVLTCVRRWGGAGAQQASSHRVLLAAANLRRGAVAANKLYPSGACLARVRRARAALPALDTRPGAPRPVGALTCRRTETDSYANERLPETWTPTAEVVNSRVASARPYARIAATAAQKRARMPRSALFCLAVRAFCAHACAPARRCSGCVPVPAGGGAGHRPRRAVKPQRAMSTCDRAPACGAGP